MCIILFLCFNTLAFSQNWLWAKSASGPAEGSAMATDASGNVFVSGNFIGNNIIFGSYTLTNPNAGSWEFCLVKYDVTGNVLWAKSSIGKNSWINNITTDAFGNVYAIGSFDSTIILGSFTLNSLGGDFFVVKYNPSGDVLWAKSSGGTGHGSGSSVATDASGGVYVTGNFNSPSISFGSNTIINNNPPGYTDIFLAKYDVSGNALWAKSMTGAGWANHVAIDASGNAYLVGSFSSSNITFGTTTLTNSGGEDIFLVKYNSSGNVLWAKNIGGTGNDEGWSVASDNFGNFYMTGIFDSPLISIDSHTLTNAGCFDIFLAKYDATGNILWVKNAGGTGNDRTGSGGLSIDVSGNAYMSGSFGDSWCGWDSITFGSYVLTEPVGTWDPMFIVKYDKNGNVLCASALKSGGNDVDFPNAVTTDAFGNAYTGGDFGLDPFVVGTTTLGLSGGGENIFVAKYTCCGNVTAQISGKDTVCSGSSVELNASGGLLYSWNTGAKGATINVIPTSTTTYTLNVTDNYGCIGNATYTITLKQSPNASISGSIDILPEQSTILTANGEGNYLWSTGETTTSISVTPVVTSDYCVTVSDTNKCYDNACVRVTVENKFGVPNAFSPNDDGHNDLFILQGWKNCVSEFTIIIYDRWGEKVFETNDPTIAWNGTYNSKLLDAGVFAYYINATVINGEKIIKKGNISLIR